MGKGMNLSPSGVGVPLTSQNLLDVRMQVGVVVVGQVCSVAVGELRDDVGEGVAVAGHGARLAEASVKAFQEVKPLHGAS